MRRQILCKAVMNEIGAMMVSSRTAVANKQQANQAAMAELQGLVGKSREVVTKLWQKIATEKAAYNAALAEYKVNHANFSAKRAALMDMLNSAKMDAMLAQSAQAMEDSWTTVGLQRAMRELSRLMSADFERVFAASEDIKKLMQGVYNTFVEKFGFQRMTLPSLDLELHATKLKLLVAETEEFSRDPINVANYKSFFVKKFHASLVAQARTLFSDARAQSERWVQAVTLPLEIQMKDHKQQLQSRLDNLSKINEKSTGINEQLAELKAVGEGLRKQREMIDGLLQRVSREEAVAAAAPAPGPAEATAPMMPPELMETTKLSVFEAPLTITRRAARAQEVFREVAHVKEEAPKPVAPKPAAPAKPAAAPMISDDMLAALARRDADSTLNERAAAADTTINQRGSDGEKTQRLPAFDPRLYNPDGSRKSAEPGAQPPGADRTQKMNPGDTQKLDFTGTQKLDPGQTQKLAPEATQKLDLSIEKLKEARRLLQATQKT